MPSTTNFGWTTPADTDLVKDGASAIRTLGNGIDTSFVDLKGGTTGQVLSKASNTDLDFSWVTDATGIPATIFDAKGDIIAASAADTALRLAVGTNGQYLSADSSTATGLKWVTPSPSGKVLQVIFGSTNTSVTTTSATYVDSNLTASITPSAASSNILILVSQNGVYKQTDNNGADLQVVRDSTALIQFADRLGYNNSTSVRNVVAASCSYLDSPASTSALTYKTQIRTDGAGTIVAQQNSEYSTITLIEIGA